MNDHDLLNTTAAQPIIRFFWCKLGSVFNLLANSYALSLTVTNQVPCLKLCMYFSFPVDPPICLLWQYYEYQRGSKGFFLHLHFDNVWSNSTETTKEHLTLLYRNSRRRKSSELAMDLPVRYNNVLLTGPLSSNKGDGCRAVRTMHLPGFFSSVPPACISALVAGTPNFRTSFQMFIRCKMGLKRRQSRTTMVTPFVETKLAAVLSHNNSVGIRHAGIYCAFKTNSVFARLYDVMNVLMTKTCLTVPFVGVTDFTTRGAPKGGEGCRVATPQIHHRQN